LSERDLSGQTLLVIDKPAGVACTAQRHELWRYRGPAGIEGADLGAGAGLDRDTTLFARCADRATLTALHALIRTAACHRPT